MYLLVTKIYRGYRQRMDPGRNTNCFLYMADYTSILKKSLAYLSDIIPSLLTSLIVCLF